MTHSVHNKKVMMKENNAMSHLKLLLVVEIPVCGIYNDEKFINGSGNKTDSAHEH